MYQQTRDSSKVLAVVGGLDLVKHDKMKEAIARFSRSKGPRFVGVRYLLVWDEEDYLAREDVHQGEGDGGCGHQEIRHGEVSYQDIPGI